MGLLQVGKAAVSTVLSDQWREYFYCDSLDERVLMKKGAPRRGKNNFNTKASDNVITNGSIVAVNEGQCMIIVDNGAIVEVSAEPGQFVWDSSSEPTIFYGGLKKGIVDSFNQWKKRVTFAGDTATDQRVYFFNTKDIFGNKYGTQNPIPFRLIDRNINLDVEFGIRCHGEYSYRIADPILFYKKVCGNVTDEYTRDRIDSQLKSELLTALQPAFADISAKGIRYSELPAHSDDIAEALNTHLTETWGKHYGIEIASFGLSSATISEEDAQKIQTLQLNATLRDPGMGAATLTAAQAQAMKDAANNTSTGPMMAFAGMNMANMAGGMNANTLYGMAQQNQQASQMQQQAQAPQMAPQGVVGAMGTNGAAPEQPKMQAGGWTCECGASNNGNFCTNCGKPRPKPATWFCPQCGTENGGNFCTNCGTKRP
ncbi:SPFH domain-containing protein [Oribacterium sp. WCC10]|uniref:SPFH domain-containing protein n=1 Tax=Oribacterium sp. WCC10 TaxID=1855343 RepID=UPI0008F09D11|nr:SPFH domain-containing protein [Oribacterium sp. WCC10]SFG19195.1 Membrane protease subunit, stomatin/prohibitin family, contains C-terminal Zn-ribbon domain [Oribacterium sp. WCC10]